MKILQALKECEVPLADVIEFLSDREEEILILSELENLIIKHKQEMFEEWPWLKDYVYMLDSH